MASIVTHPLVPLGLAVCCGHRVIGGRLLLVACFATVVADLDVLAFSLGIPYSSPFGHRGFTHSVAFALALAGFCAWHARAVERPPATVFLVILVAAVSHPLLDALTDGGLGVALAWPFSDERFFAPWRPIAVSPIGFRGFLTPRGLAVLGSEIVWVWAPIAAVALGGLGWRRYRGRVIRR